MDIRYSANQKDFKRYTTEEVRAEFLIEGLYVADSVRAVYSHVDRMVTEVNPALCQGCGTCVAACPAGAISGTVFSNEQICAQIDGLLKYSFEPAVAAGQD